MANRKDSKGRVLKPNESQRPDGRYQFSKMINGKRYTIYDMDIVELRKKELELLNSIEDGSVKARQKKYTVDSYAEYWFSKYAKRGRKISTASRYEYAYKHYLSSKIGYIKLVDLNNAQVQDAVNDIIDKGLSYTTINMAVISIYEIMETAIDEELILRNPARNIVVPEREYKEKEALSKEDIDLFFTALNNDPHHSFYAPMYTVLFNTGMRISELCALTWEDIDYKNHTISITKNQYYINEDGKKNFYISTPKTKTSIRVIPMNEAVEKALKSQKKLYNKAGIILPSLPQIDASGREIGRIHGFIFFSTEYKFMRQTTAYTVIDDVIKKYNAQAEKNHTKKLKHFSPHQARHTFTSLAYEAGIDVKYTSEILGHASTKITMDRYTHLSEENKKTQVEKINRINIS
ncbi:MAG: site-specific integrase [Clostridia bacterium]|nr:site-specific integrase [Clostridia bacterium]